MAAQKYQIIGSEVIKDSQVPSEVVMFIVAMGKSTDIKPTQDNYKIAMGSIAKEFDTGKKFYWDTENEEWVPEGSATEGSGS